MENQRNEIEESFPPVPAWKPDFRSEYAELVERFAYYTDRDKDFLILKYGTIVLLENGLDDAAAEEYAREVVTEIFEYHPDMNPQKMDDGNVLVFYNYPAFNVVLEKLAREHWTAIDQNHQQGLCPDEVLMTPLGNNLFDDFGKKALYGRCCFFMDAQEFEVQDVIRNAA